MSEVQETRPSSVCLFGVSPTVGNLGVRALSTSLISIVARLTEDPEINLLCGNREGRRDHVEVDGRSIEVNLINFRLSPRSRLRDHLAWILLLAFLYRCLPLKGLRSHLCRRTPWLGRLREADWIGDIRGGDSFSDIYGIRRLLIGSIPNLICRLLGKDYVMLPQTYGPFDRWLSRRVAAAVMNSAESIYSRDRRSLTVIRELLGARAESKTIRTCPDVAFTLEPRQPGAVSFEPPLPPEHEEPRIGLNVSGLLYMGGYSRDNMFHLRSDYPEMIDTLMQALLRETEARIVLIPHVWGDSLESDVSACRKIREAFSRTEAGHRVHMLTSEHDEREIKAVIGECDFFIGSRMHACIAAMSQGIPAAALAYSGKFLGVFDMAGAGDLVLDARELETRDIVEGCLALYRRRDAWREELASRMDRCRRDVMATMAEALGVEYEPGGGGAPESGRGASDHSESGTG